MHYYTFHINDYRSSTSHLSNAEDLAYRRMLDLYYELENPLPLDSKWIARRIRCDVVDVETILGEMFLRTPDGYANKRADRELEKILSITHKKRKDPPSPPGGVGVGVPPGVGLGNGEWGMGSSVEEREHEREEIPKKIRKPRIPKPKPDMALFEKFLEAYRKRDDIKKAEKAWIKNVGCDEALAKEVILAAEVYASFEAVKKEDRKYQPYPATWLNGERWRDERTQKEVANRKKSPSLDDENIDWDTPAF